MAEVRPVHGDQTVKQKVLAADRSLAEKGVVPVQPRRKGQTPKQLVGSIATHAILILASVIFVFPLLWVIMASLRPSDDAFSLDFIPKHPSLDNYVGVITNPDFPFLSYASNSVIVAVLTMIVGLSFALPAAYALSRFEFLGKQGVLLSFLITQMFPGALLLVPLLRLYTQAGLIGNPYALVFAYATTALPFSVYMMKNFFDAVPRELDQAGLLDGLTWFGVFWRIVAPLTIPGIAVVAFFNFLGAWNEFMFARAFLTDQTSQTLPVGLQNYVFQFKADWGLLTAGSIIVTIPVLFLFMWAQRYLITGLTGGSVKG